MKGIYDPQKIPQHFFYFAWKKVQSFYHAEHGFYDPVELMEFELNLDQKLQEIRMNFKDLTYVPSRTYTYLLPKSPKDGIPRFRPIVQFSVTDQVAWTVVTLVLSEWFDTNEMIGELIPVENLEQRGQYNWMLPWSFNNRIKRVFQKNEFDENYDRLYVDYNNKSLYESFQWGLRNLRETRKAQIESILIKHDEYFIGEADIKEFYPNLKKKFIKEAIYSRFKCLSAGGLSDCFSKWEAILEQMFEFEIDYTSILVELQSFNSNSFNLLVEGLKVNDTSISSINKYLNQTLPIGLISSGFLANCALTHYFDSKIQEYIQIRSEGNIQIYFTRYTDDMMIVSSHGEEILKFIDKIRELLEEIGLGLAEEKVKPKRNTPKRDELDKIMKKLSSLSTPDGELEDFSEFLKKMNHELDEDEKLKPMLKEDRIPGSTSVIEMLSQIGDNNLWAMNHEELEDYIRELLRLIDTRFDETEIKDETKVSFSAWRIRTSIAEYGARGKNIEVFNAKDKILKAIDTYPYKPSLIDYYIMHLFDISSSEAISKHLATFLNKFRTKASYKEIGNVAGNGYGSYLRSRVLVAISENWNLLPYSLRKSAQGVIFRSVMNWYKHHPEWHEKAALYFLFSKIDLQRDPGAMLGEQLQSETNEILKNAFALFKMNQKEESYFYEDFDINKDFNPARLKVLLTNMKKRRVKDDQDKNLIRDEEKDFIHWVWDLFKKHTERERNNAGHSNSTLKFSIYLAKHHIESIPSHLYIYWMMMPDNLLSEALNESLDMYEVLDSLVSEWVGYSPVKSKLKHVIAFTDALKSLENNNINNKCYCYVRGRMTNIGRIKQALFMETNGLKLLPEKWQTDILYNDNQPSTSLDSVPIPLLDWLTVVASGKGKEDYRGIVNSLSELEIIHLMVVIIKEANKCAPDLFTIRKINISIGSWSTWREQLRQTAKLEVKREEGQFPKISIRDDQLDPYSQKMKKIMHYVKKQWPNPSDSNDYIYCLVFSILFMSISLSSKSKEYYNLSSIFKWHSLQQIINETNGPSSTISSLLVSTLNILTQIYKLQYEDLGNVKLPYKAMSTDDVISLEVYEKRIKEQLRLSNENVVKWSQGLLEVIHVNMDIISKDGSNGNR